MASTDDWFDAKGAAAYLGYTVAALYNWRYGRRDTLGPRSFKTGGRLRYKRSDLDAWLARNERPGDVEADQLHTAG